MSETKRTTVIGKIREGIYTSIVLQEVPTFCLLSSHWIHRPLHLQLFTSRLSLNLSSFCATAIYTEAAKSQLTGEGCGPSRTKER